MVLPLFPEYSLVVPYFADPVVHCRHRPQPVLVTAVTKASSEAIMIKTFFAILIIRGTVTTVMAADVIITDVIVLGLGLRDAVMAVVKIAVSWNEK